MERNARITDCRRTDVTNLAGRVISQASVQGVLGSVRSVPETGETPTSERDALAEVLGYQRAALIRKLDGVSEEDARRTPTASSLSLLGIVKHSAVWERRWFQVAVAGRRFPGEWPENRGGGPDQTFELVDGDTVESVIAHYREQVAESLRVVEAVDLDAPCAWSGMAHVNVRWIVLHMIEETARHAGHADIIRETIDGSRGV